MANTANCLPEEKEFREVSIKRLVGQVNPIAFEKIKAGVKNRGLTLQAALILSLIEYLELDLTLEQASPDYNYTEEEE